MTYLDADQPGHGPGDHDDLPDWIVWTPSRLSLIFTASTNRPVVLSGLGCAGEATATRATQPLVELIVTGEGRARTTTRFTDTGVGSRLRYLRHTTGSEQGEERLDIVQADALTGMRVTTTFIASTQISAARVVSSVINESNEPQVLEAVSSFATGAVVYPGESTSDLVLYSGTGEQLAENRWSARPLWSHTALADFNSALHNQPGRGAIEAISTSTWSTARALPTAALENRVTGRSLAWQVEHNGGWRWEVDNVRDSEDSVAIVLLGPEDLDHHWSEELAPGASFTTIPISIAVAATGFVGGIGELTQHRRWLRRSRRTDRGSLLVFNDYMNTINGDPTTERLLPLIDAAGRAGAECFCIDAGWYDDTDLGDWWPTVGEWIPSDRRFPGGGLARVVTAIRDAGMKVGLWLFPQPWMKNEEIAFTMVTGLSGRLYLSGFLDGMAPDQLQLVSEATALFKQIRGDTAKAVPSWPLGLPDWYADSVALTLNAPKRTLVYVWHRGSEDAEIALRLEPGVRAEHLLECYPRHLTAWEASDAHAGSVLLSPGLAGPSARVYQILKEPA